MRKKQPEKKKQQPAAPPAHHSDFRRFGMAVTNTVLKNIKMAQAVLCDPLAHPLALLEEIKKIGKEALLWKPETLMAEIDKRCSGWTADKITAALTHFHDTGEILTDVPVLLRQKIYALRVIATSDSPHNEWHIFEKVGCAFNDRVANFNVVEGLSPAECARTVAIIEAVRPDQYSTEIKAYIAASCHEEGFYTLAPSRYLEMSDSLLQMMNREQSGRSSAPDRVKHITDLLTSYKKTPPEKLNESDIWQVQAVKLLAIDTAGDEATKF